MTELKQMLSGASHQHEVEAAAASRQREVETAAAIRQRESELSAVRERIERVERDAREKAKEADELRSHLRKKDQQCDILRAELAAQSQRSQSERARLTQEVEEATTNGLRDEQRRCAMALQRQAEEHKRQTATLQAAVKKAHQKASSTRQEYRQTCQNLCKRVEQLKQERAIAVRVCEENRTACELRLAEIGLAMGGGSRCSVALDVAGIGGLGQLSHSLTKPALTSSYDATGLAASRRERLAIAERLEQNAKQVKARISAESREGVPTAKEEPLRNASALLAT